MGSSIFQDNLLNIIKTLSRKHQNNMWNLLKVKHKDTRTTLLIIDVVLLFLLLIWTNFTNGFSYSIGDFQQVNPGRVIPKKWR